MIDFASPKAFSKSSSIPGRTESNACSVITEPSWLIFHVRPTEAAPAATLRVQPSDTSYAPVRPVGGVERRAAKEIALP